MRAGRQIVKRSAGAAAALLALSAPAGAGVELFVGGCLASAYASFGKIDGPRIEQLVAGLESPMTPPESVALRLESVADSKVVLRMEVSMPGSRADAIALRPVLIETGCRFTTGEVERQLQCRYRTREFLTPLEDSSCRAPTRAR